jgi:hypothetical protein
MDRRISGAIFGTNPIPEQVADRLYLAQHMLNHHFSWSEAVYLEICKTPDPHWRLAGIRIDESEPLIAEGWTEVESNWGACLFVAFFQWISTQVPDAMAVVRDVAGEFVLPRYVRFCDGVPSFESADLADLRVEYRGIRRADLLAQLDGAEAKAKRGEFFSGDLAAGYRDVAEIKALGLSVADLEGLTVVEVSRLLTFPWQTEWLTRR